MIPSPRTTIQAGDLLFRMKVEIQGMAYVPEKQEQ